MPKKPKKRSANALVVVVGLVLAFALGLAVGRSMGQNWVEERTGGDGSMSQARKKMLQLEDGRWVNHGPYLGYYQDGKTLKEQGEYFRGLKHGPWTEYDAHGKVKRKGSYVNGLAQADWRDWDENGLEKPASKRQDISPNQ